MKIAFINQPWNNVVPPVRAGSIAIWNYQVAIRLAKSHDVTIYSRREWSQPKTDQYMGVIFRRVWIAPDIWLNRILKRFFRSGVRKPFFSSIWYYFLYILRIALDARFRGDPPDIVHINNLSQFVPVIRKILPQSKIVLHMQCEWLTQLNSALIESRLRQSDLILACSSHVIDLVQESFPIYQDACHVIFNAVNEDSFSSESIGLRDKDDNVRIVFVGRVSPEKGTHVLVNAFQKAAQRVPDIKLLIIGPDAVTPHDFLVGLGDVSIVQELERFYQPKTTYQQKLDDSVLPEMKDKISFQGPIPHDQLVELYQAANIMVNPSLSEAFGMSLVEAMACELPVIASRVGGMKEIVLDNQTGIFVEPGDEASLEEAIVRLALDVNLRRSMGKIGRQRVIEKFTWDQISNTLLRYYESLFIG